MSSSSKDKAALLFDDLEDDATMAPRSDPKEDQSSKKEAAEVPVEPDEVVIGDLHEIESVNNHLDSLNSALDAIEQRNDDIRAQLLELLHSNREIRQSIQQPDTEKSKEQQSADGPNGDDSEMQ